jgi:hypothetical protein
MAAWKWGIVVVLFVGFGVSLGLRLHPGGPLRPAQSPKPPASWDSDAIKARFDHLDIEGSGKTLTFGYVLENTTQSDYRVPDGTHVLLAASLKQERSISNVNDPRLLRIDYPIFVPAKGRLLLWIHVAASFSEIPSPKSGAGKEEWRKYRAGLAQSVANRMGNLNGFVIFDEGNRYRIDLPRGW